MIVDLQIIRSMMRELLATSGADEKDIETIVKIKLDKDLHKNYFSGLKEMTGEPLGAMETLQKSIGKKETIEVEMPALRLINCNGRPTSLVTADHIPQLCNMARANGIAMMGLYNGGYQEALEMFARRIAAQDLVAIISSTGGPQGVVPYGGSTGVMGTNPIAYGIPTDGLPIVFDAATAQHTYGSIRLTKEAGGRLPENAYLDKDGNWTTDPNAARSIIPFGGHKGYAINVLLEVMGGALVRAKSGLLQKDATDLGSFLIAIDPAAFGPLNEFKAQTTRLARDIEAVKPAVGYTEVRAPGYKGERHRRKVLQTGKIEINDSIWNEFKYAYDKLTTKTL
jgi:LDH2 family malate/lactate/ureidoglycolate dehydrogenase